MLISIWIRWYMSNDNPEQESPLCRQLIKSDSGHSNRIAGMTSSSILDLGIPVLGCLLESEFAAFALLSLLALTIFPCCYTVPRQFIFYRIKTIPYSWWFCSGSWWTLSCQSWRRFMQPFMSFKIVRPLEFFGTHNTLVLWTVCMSSLVPCQILSWRK